MKAVFLLSCVIVASATLHGQTSDFSRTNFRKADSIAGLYPKNSLQDLHGLADKLTRSLSTDEGKFRAIYKWICDNIDNDYALYLENKRKREKLKTPADLKVWNKKFSALVFRNLIKRQQTVCSGYSYLVKEMASFAGLSCITIDGYGRTQKSNIGGSGILNHSWNAICLHEKWYLCDATWSAGAVDANRLEYIRKFDEAYFLPDPLLFIRNHFPLDSSWTLLKNKPTLNEFLNRPLIYSAAYTYAITALMPETFVVGATKGKRISFEFTKHGGKNIENVELSINGRNAIIAEHPLLHQKPEGHFCINHIFTSKGTYIVHIIFDGHYVCAYTINVT